MVGEGRASEKMVGEIVRHQTKVRMRHNAEKGVEGRGASRKSLCTVKRLI